MAGCCVAVVVVLVAAAGCCVAVAVVFVAAAGWCIVVGLVVAAMIGCWSVGPWATAVVVSGSLLQV